MDNPLIQFLDTALNSETVSQNTLDEALKSIQNTSVSRRLKSVQQGKTKVRYNDPFYLLGEENQELEAAILRAIEYIEQQGLTLSRRLILDVGLTQRELAAMVELNHDVCYLVVSAEESEDYFSHAVHEITHCHFSSGNRFLDEAAAYYFELSSAGNFPQKAQEEAGTFLDDFLDIPALLTYRAENDPFFAQLQPKTRFAVHAVGALFFDYILKLKGIAALQDYYSGHKQNLRTSNALNLMLDWLGNDLPGKNLPTIDSLVGTTSPRDLQPAVKKSYPEVEKLFVTGELRALQQDFNALMAHYSKHGCNAKNLADEEVLILLAVAVQESFKGALSGKLYAFICSQIEIFLADKDESWRHYNLYKSMLNMLSLPYEGNMLDSMLIIDEAKLSIKSSLEKWNDDWISASFLSRLVWNSPSESADDRQEAIELLKPIAAQEQFKDKVSPLVDSMQHALSSEEN